MATQKTTSINRVAIIGAGPTGIACAKYLLAEKAFKTIAIFEQRQNVGGIWNLSGTDRTRRIPIPQIDPRYGTGTSSSGMNDSLEFESPLYDYLETNIPRTMMAYSDMPFAKDLPLYPKHDDVLRYLEAYAEPVRHLIHFHTQVVQVKPLDRPAHASRLAQQWSVTTKDLQTGTLQEAKYDAVIVANGHYTVPHVPAIPGIAEWHTKYPNAIMHSKAYRRPEDFAGQKVLVIGNSASGLDIAGQLAPCAQQPVYLASRSASQLAPTGGGPNWRKDVSEIEEFLVDDGNRTVRTKNNELISNLDAVIFATGYFYSFPFLSTSSTPSTSNSSSKTQSPSPTDSSTSLDFAPAQNDVTTTPSSSTTKAPPTTTPLPPLTTTGLRTHQIYHHFLHTTHPTLSLPLLNLKVVPFPLAENQAAVIARLWSGRLDLPSQSEMCKWERDEEERLLAAHRLRPASGTDTASGDTVSAHDPDESANPGTKVKYEGGFHTLTYPEDAAQLNTLHAWASSARMDPRLENNGVGKLGTRWDEESVWLRGQFPNIKAAYARLREGRFRVRCVEELEGWRGAFQRWKRETSEEEQADLFRRAGVVGW